MNKLHIGGFPNRKANLHRGFYRPSIGDTVIYDSDRYYQDPRVEVYEQLYNQNPKNFGTILNKIARDPHQGLSVKTLPFSYVVWSDLDGTHQIITRIEEIVITMVQGYKKNLTYYSKLNIGTKVIVSTGEHPNKSPSFYEGHRSYYSGKRKQFIDSLNRSVYIGTVTKAHKNNYYEVEYIYRKKLKKKKLPRHHLKIIDRLNSTQILEYEKISTIRNSLLGLISSKKKYSIGDTIMCYWKRRNNSKSTKNIQATILNIKKNKYLIWFDGDGIQQLLPKNYINKVIISSKNGYKNKHLYYCELAIGVKVICCTNVLINDLKNIFSKTDKDQYVGIITKKYKDNYYEVEYVNNKNKVIKQKLPRHQLKLFDRLSNNQISSYIKIPNIMRSLFFNVAPKTEKQCRETQWDDDDKCYMDPVMPDCITTQNGVMSPSENCYTKSTMLRLFNNGLTAKEPLTRVKFNYDQVKNLTSKSLVPPKSKKPLKRRFVNKIKKVKKVKRIKKVKKVSKITSIKGKSIKIGDLLKIFNTKTKNQLPKKTSRKISYRKALKVMRTLDKNIVIDNGKYFLQFKGVGKYFSDLVDKELKKKRATKKKGKTKSKKSKKKVTIKEKRERCKNRGLVYDSTTKRCRKSKRKRKRK